MRLVNSTCDLRSARPLRSSARPLPSMVRGEDSYRVTTTSASMRALRLVLEPSHLVRLCTWATLIGLSIAFLIWAADSANLSDANGYWAAAIRLGEGRALYPAITDPNAADVFRYAPWFAAMWVPLTYAPKALVMTGWVITLVAASLVAALPLLRSSSTSIRLGGVLLVCVLLRTTAVGNVQPLVMALLMLGLRSRVAPVCIALAASLKAVPFLFVLVLLRQRRWLAAGIASVLTAILVLPMALWRAPGLDAAGASLSLFYQLNPMVWAGAAGLITAVAVLETARKKRYAPLWTAAAAVAVLPRLLLYDASYLAVGFAEADEVRRTQL